MESPAGKITTAWQRNAGVMRLEVTVPPNTQATIYFPSGKHAPVTVAAGRHVFTGQE
jgi:hypothetical protein